MADHQDARGHPADDLIRAAERKRAVRSARSERSAPGGGAKRMGLADPDTAYRRRWATLGVLCVSLLVIGLDNTILNVALPTLSRDLRRHDSQLQWIVDAYILVFAGLLLTAGSLGDRFGRARALRRRAGRLRRRVPLGRLVGVAGRADRRPRA